MKRRGTNAKKSDLHPYVVCPPLLEVLEKVFKAGLDIVRLADHFHALALLAPHQNILLLRWARKVGKSWKRGYHCPELWE